MKGERGGAATAPTQPEKVNKKEVEKEKQNETDPTDRRKDYSYLPEMCYKLDLIRRSGSISPDI